MNTQAFVDSVAYQTQRLCDEIAEIEAGKRKVFVEGEDISPKEAEKLRHQVTENMTILDRLRNTAVSKAS